MKNRVIATTAAGMEKDRSNRESAQEYNRSLKRQIGIIRKIDARQNGRMFVLVDVPDGRGGLRPFGQDKTPVAIADAPLDILLRYGGVRPGQIVEILYRGVGEISSATAHIIGDEEQGFKNVEAVPEEGFSVASSLPFEPMGII